MPDFRKPVKKYSNPDELYGERPKDYSRGANNYGVATPDAPAGLDELAQLTTGMGQIPGTDRRALENPRTVEERRAAARLGTFEAQYGGGAQPNPVGPAGAWRDSLSADEAWIIQRESGFRPDAWNNTVVYDRGKRLGNAHGLGQIVSDIPREQRSTDPNEQLAAFRAYVSGRYGTTARAVEFWKANGWY